MFKQINLIVKKQNEKTIQQKDIYTKHMINSFNHILEKNNECLHKKDDEICVSLSHYNYSYQPGFEKDFINYLKDNGAKSVKFNHIPYIDDEIPPFSRIVLKNEIQNKKNKFRLCKLDFYFHL